jgi:hypothetical protein
MQLYDPVKTFDIQIGDNHYLHARPLEVIRTKILSGEYNIVRDCPHADPNEFLSISPGQPDRTHIVCCNGRHFRVGARLSAFPLLPQFAMETKGFIDDMGACDELACKHSIEIPIDWMWKHARALLRHIDVLVPVPEGKVLYSRISFESGRDAGTHIASYDAGMLVLPSMMRKLSLLSEGEEIATSEVRWYRQNRCVTRHYVYRNENGVMCKIFSGGG